MGNSQLPRPAAFFDRDGVLNVDHGYVFRPADFEWTEGAVDAIRWLNEAGYLVFVVTNQSGVARGYYGEDDLRSLNAWLKDELAAVGAHIDEIFHCPHGPEDDCECRKPKPGMLIQAMRKWPVDRERSFLIGDSPSDLEAATAAGVKGYMYREGSLLEQVRQIVDRPSSV